MDFRASTLTVSGMGTTQGDVGSPVGIDDMTVVSLCGTELASCF
jgi:hypothetical protein